MPRWNAWHLQAYKRAIGRAVERVKAADTEAHVLDVGAGSGILSLMAAQAGASSVVAAELNECLVNVTRKVHKPWKVGPTTGWPIVLEQPRPGV
jgi:ribosomal protein L11 methylase PrmA